MKSVFGPDRPEERVRGYYLHDAVLVSSLEAVLRYENERQGGSGRWRERERQIEKERERDTISVGFDCRTYCCLDHRRAGVFYRRVIPIVFFSFFFLKVQDEEARDIGIEISKAKISNMSIIMTDTIL